MTRIDEKMDLFEKTALGMGYDPDEVSSFTSLARIAEEEKALAPDKVSERAIAQDKREAESFLSLGDIATQEDYNSLSIGAKSIVQKNPQGFKVMSEEEQGAFDDASSMRSSSQNVIDILDQIESGELGREQGRTALEFAAAKMAEETFEIGGKALTAMEQALLIYFKLKQLNVKMVI